MTDLPQRTILPIPDRPYDPAATGYGTGVQGMIDRLAALGGELLVRSKPGSGTAVAGTLPV